MLKPKDFAEKIGVTVKTLQNWDNNGILKAQRTPTNRRCYTEKTNTYFTLINTILAGYRPSIARAIGK